MRLVLLMLLVAGAVVDPASAADRDLVPPAVSGAVKTGKERLTTKPSDEQRMDDCKVPSALRTVPRPGCPESAGR